MELDILEKANKIATELSFCKTQLEKIGYTQSKNVVERNSYLEFNGVEGKITIPETLFRTIGKLVESEYVQKINNLEKELKNL